MSSFFALDLKIMNIEPFDPDLTDGYDDYELPGGYRTADGKKLQTNPKKMRIVSIMVSPGIMARCPVDVSAMNFKEDQAVKVIMYGKKVACLANIEDKTYVSFSEPLRKRFNMPRVTMGVNMAIVTVFAGYIVALILKHQQAKMALVIVEGSAFLGFISSVIYAIYYFINDTEAAERLKHYMQKILK